MVRVCFSYKRKTYENTFQKKEFHLDEVFPMEVEKSILSRYYITIKQNHISLLNTKTKDLKQKENSLSYKDGDVELMIWVNKKSPSKKGLKTDILTAELPQKNSSYYLWEEESGKVWEIGDRPITLVGSDVDCHIVLENRHASFHHGSFFIGEWGRISFRDNNSSNGTFLNGLKIVKAELKNGSVLGIGKKKYTLLNSAPELNYSRHESVNKVFMMTKKMLEHGLLVLRGPSSSGRSHLITAVLSSQLKEAELFQLDLRTIPEELQFTSLFGAAPRSFSSGERGVLGALENPDAQLILIRGLSSLLAEIKPAFLKAIDTGEFRSLGSLNLKSLSAKVAIILDSNENIDGAMDLWLSSFEVEMPSLKTRPKDLIYIFETGLQKKLAEAAKNLLVNYLWPGEFSELFSLIQKIELSESHSEIITVEELEKYLGGV